MPRSWLALVSVSGAQLTINAISWSILSLDLSPASDRTTPSETIYEVWDPPNLSTPPHSRLYCLEPLGIGTTEVEGLTSYLMRLAAAHGVSVGRLVMGEMAPRFQPPKGRSALFDGSSRGLHSLGQVARDLVWLLQRLTGRLDLHYLTVLPWAAIMAARGLLYPHRTWCSGCLEAQRQAGAVIAEPLWWAFKQIQICPTHNQALQNVCPHCTKTIPWLAPRARAGHCPYCCCWLGIVPHPDLLAPPDLSAGERQWQVWVVTAIGNLLAAGPALAETALNEAFIAGLSGYCAQLTSGHVGTFAAVLAKYHFHISTPTLKLWLLGEKRPAFERFLELCYCLDTQPSSFLTQLPALAATVNLRPLPLDQPSLPWQKDPLPLALIQRGLQAILAQPEDPPPSLQQVATRLSCSQPSLARYFPDQCTTIVERHRAYRKSRKVRRLQRLRETVRQATFSVHAQGFHPTRSRVAKQLGQPTFKLNRDAQGAWQDALHELGLSP